jgi:mRNA-degrading endonuclease toxin of MazEF toxin-antitoxin module
MAKRDEVWLVDLGLAQKVRPALVLSVPFADGDRVLLTVVPHSTALRGSQFEVEVRSHFFGRAPLWHKASLRFRLSMLFDDWVA